MHFGEKTGCIEKMFVKLEMTRASAGSSLVSKINKETNHYCRKIKKILPDHTFLEDYELKFHMSCGFYLKGVV